MEILYQIHQWTGYIVTVVVLVTAFIAFGRARDAREFEPGLYRVVFMILGVQILLGLGLYVQRQAWNAGPLVAYLHPILAILAIGVGQMMLGKARKTQLAVDAHRASGRGLIISFLFVVGAVAAASWPA